jgi:phage terminase small subunit
MTENQRIFCEEYLKDRNATQAYLRTYKGVKDPEKAKKLASKLLKTSNVAAYIKQKLDEVHSQNTADIAEIEEYLTSVMRGKSSSSVMAIVSGKSGTKALIIDKPPDEKERLKAAELLGKARCMFTEKVEVDADVALDVVIDYGNEDSESKNG